MELSDRKVFGFLCALQGVGAAFVAIFLAAYLVGLPTTAVLHSEPVFRIPLVIFGAIFLALILITVALAVLQKKSN